MGQFFTARWKPLSALLLLGLGLYAARRPAADPAPAAAGLEPAGLRDAPAQLSLRPEPAPVSVAPVAAKPDDPQPLRSPSPETVAALGDPDAGDLDVDSLLQELDALQGISQEEVLALREAGLDVDELGYSLSVSGAAGGVPLRTLGNRLDVQRPCHHAC